MKIFASTHLAADEPTGPVGPRSGFGHDLARGKGTYLYIDVKRCLPSTHTLRSPPSSDECTTLARHFGASGQIVRGRVPNITGGT